MRLKKKIRHFLWGTSKGKDKLHLVAFEGVFLPFDLGDLGLKRMRETNLSLLCKWFWKLKENHLWVRLLKEKYDTEIGGVSPKRAKNQLG